MTELTLPKNNYKLQFDGCSKSNPGLAGCGAVIYYNDKEIWSDYLFVGKSETNNKAEYSGLLLGLEAANKLNIKTLLVEGDSLLVINQMIGKYKCNSPNLIELYDKSKELEKKFDNVFYQHIYRNFNKRADYLSNEAIKLHSIS